MEMVALSVAAILIGMVGGVVVGAMDVVWECWL
jgi:hypothetical protein